MYTCTLLILPYKRVRYPAAQVRPVSLWMAAIAPIIIAALYLFCNDPRAKQLIYKQRTLDNFDREH